jgi:hypothetical protein
MSEQGRQTTDSIRDLIENVDEQLHEARLIRGYLNDRSRRSQFFPERRKAPRIPSMDSTKPRQSE